MSAPVRFEIDAMLVKLARYLRCLGYDAACAPETSLATRIERADREGRVFVTRSGHIGQQEKVPARMLRIASQDPTEQVREIFAALSIDLALVPFTRCIRCNIPLDALPKDETVAERVPARVFAAYAHFFRCPGCGTVFWKGSHVRNTCRKLGVTDASEP